MKVSNEQSSDSSRGSKASSDEVACDNIRLLTGREGKDGNPGSENVSECVHLVVFVSS